MSTQAEWDRLIIVVFTLVVGCKPKQLTVEEYLNLPVWNKEEAAFNLINEIPEQESLEAIKQALNQAAVLFAEVGEELLQIKTNNHQITQLNELQLLICSIYHETAREFNESEDIDALNRLMEADQKMAEFLLLAEEE